MEGLCFGVPEAEVWPSEPAEWGAGGRPVLGEDRGTGGKDSFNLGDPSWLHSSWVLPISLFHHCSQRERQLWAQLVCFLITEQ